MLQHVPVVLWIVACSVVFVVSSAYMSSLFDKEAWFEAVVLRSVTVRELQGGVSALFAAVLKLFFSASHDVSLAGMGVEFLDGTRAHLWMDVGPVIADEAALNLMFSTKGASGLKPCMLCANVFNSKYRAETRAVADVGRWSVEHQESDHTKLIFHTRATVDVMKTRLSAPMTKTALEVLQTNLGWNYEPHGLIWNDGMLQHAHPVDHCLYDWMHVFFVSGVFNITLYLLMHALKGFGITMQNVHDYVAAWKQPRRRQHVDIAGIFEKKRVTSSFEAQTWKATASEGLSVLGVLANFMLAFVSGGRSEEQKAHGRCFLLLVVVIELLLLSARHRVRGAQYAHACRLFLQSFKNLYGEEWMTPKFHSTMHFASFLDRWQTLPNCFVLERKHKLPKRWAMIVHAAAAANQDCMKYM